MPKVGLILACEHYPAVSGDVTQFDAQLRLWLGAYGTTFDTVEVFTAYDGKLPRHAGYYDAWIVSGVPLSLTASSDTNRALKHFLRAAAKFGRPIYAVNRGEHVLHTALTAIGAAPPTTSPFLSTIRNPFRSFLGRDTLHRFNPTTGMAEALSRPANTCPRRLFGALRQAA